MRLIDADAIKYIDLNRDVKNDLKVFVSFKEDVDALPTVDAVEVVRCKDCKHYGKVTKNYGICYERPNVITSQKADDFCSYGERKGGEDE